MPRKRTFQDRKFSAGDSNSQAYRDNWDAVFGEKTIERNAPSDVGVTAGETAGRGESSTQVSK